MPLSRKSGSLNFLEPSGPAQACNRSALPLPLLLLIHSISSYLSSCLLFIHSRDPHNLWIAKVHYHICLVLTHFHKPVTTISILILSFQLSMALASCCSFKYLNQNCECTSCLSYACSIHPSLLDLTCLLHFFKALTTLQK